MPQRTLSTPLPPHPTALTLKQACSHPLLGSETQRHDAAEDTATSPCAPPALSKDGLPQALPQPFQLGPAAAFRLPAAGTWSSSGPGMGGTMSPMMPAFGVGASGFDGPGTVPSRSWLTAAVRKDIANMEKPGMPKWAPAPAPCIIKEEPLIQQEVTCSAS